MIYIKTSVSGFAVANIILIIVLLFINFYKSKRINDGQYYRERPKKLPVAVVNYYYKDRITKDTIWLTLLDLISKGYYGLEKRDNEYFVFWKKDEMLELDNYDLNSFEKEMINYINVILIEKKSKFISLKDLKNAMSIDLELNVFIDRFYTLLKEEIKKNYGLIEKNKNYTLSFLISYLYYWLVFSPKTLIGYGFGLIYSIIIIVVSMILKNIKFGYKMIIELIIVMCFLAIFTIPFIPTIIESNNPIIFILSIINPLLLLVNTMVLNIEFYSKKQKELMNEVYGLKKFLNDFSLLSEKDLKYIELFRQYYAFAVALEVKIENIIPNNFEYDDNEFDTFNSMDFVDKLSDLIPTFIKFNM